MTLLRVLAVLLLASVVSAQISTPPTCAGAVTDREVLKTPGGRITFHLKFHNASGMFDARSVVKLRRHGGADASCTDGDVLDFLIDELRKQRSLLP